MAVTGSQTSENGDALLVSLQEPYKNVVEVLSYSDEVENESTSVYFNKYFRWGIDGVTYSDWITLTDASLIGLLLNPHNPLWVQYKYEQVGDGLLIFKSISLEIVTDNGVICKIPQINCTDSNSLSGSQNLVVDCCAGSWNPYDLSRASQMYNQLSAVASNLFGFCVKYFKTSADQRSRDVILKEYSLFNVIANAEVKIMFPDNQLPSREIQFTPLMMDFPLQFEVHIVKSAFEQVFGVGTKPQMRDYLYLEQYTNKMYEIDAVAESDDFLYAGSYWRVSLVSYQQRTAVLYPDKNIEAIKDSLVNSEDIFSKERNEELDNARKPNQYNTIGTLSNDYIRRILDKKLLIKEENIYNNWTIISKYNYQLNTITEQTDAVEYRYNSGWSDIEDRAFTFWIRPKYIKPIGINIVIVSISNSSGKVKLNSSQLPDGADSLKTGDWINIVGTASYNGIHKIISVGSTSINIDTEYTTNTLQGNSRFNKEDSNTFMVYENSLIPQSNIIAFTQTPNWFIIKINDLYFKYNIKSQNITFYNDSWYAIVVNLNSLAKQLSLFVYETVENTGSINPDISSSLMLSFMETKEYNAVKVNDSNAWKLLGCKLDITNIRIWKKPIEQELQSLILSQYVVKDTHLTLLLDNSSPQLLLSKESNSR
jgi:hypothetical protein